MKIRLKFSCEMCEHYSSCIDKYVIPDDLVCSGFVLDDDNEVDAQKKRQ